MTTSSLSQHIRRFLADAAFGLGLFFVTAALTVGNASLAADHLLDEVGDAALKVADASVARPGFLVLATVCSVLFALNSAFFRHIRRSHASARRPVYATGAAE